MNRAPHSRKRTRCARPSRSGFTVVELMVAAVVITIIVLGSISGLRSLQSERQLQGLAQNFVADIQFAMSSSLGMVQSVAVVTTSDGKGYRILRCGTTSDCRNSTETMKAVDLPASVSVTPGRSFEFSAPKGVLASGTQSACLSASGQTTTLKVGIESAVGKALVCSVGSAALGFPACAAGC